jgi:hypothetical protein
MAHPPRQEPLYSERAGLVRTAQAFTRRRASAYFSAPTFTAMAHIRFPRKEIFL